MPFEAARMTRVHPSPSSVAAAKARELRESGVKVLDLTVGEPDFDTPDNVKAAGIAAIERGDTKYTAVNGTTALRRAIIDRLRRVTGIEYTDAEISVGSGAKHVIFTALMATLSPGDEVLIPAPYWVSYPDMVVLNDGTPVIVRCPIADDFKLTPARLREGLTDRTRWLILNAPSNPTGAVYSRDELAALAAVLEEFPDVLVLTDEIYDEVFLGEGRCVGLLEVAPQLRDRVLLVNGVSKTYAMTGWRLGYCAGPKPLVSAINKLQSHMSSCPSSISQAAAAEALSGDQSFVATAAKQYRARRDLVVDRINAIDGLRALAGDGAFYVFIDCSGVIGRRTPDGTVIDGDDAFVGYLLEHARVATITGSAYGLSPFFRVSFATDEATLSAAMDAIADAVRSLTD
ncbi:aspartate transaminase [Micropruina sp.]|uniref:aspartate transaminase n=1 Tax=Micropruina sp. TaxID=2737536 RepID=UPI00260AB5B5|nr:aspartate transaminase [Micropruina sp.]